MIEPTSFILGFCTGIYITTLVWIFVTIRKMRKELEKI